MAQRQPLIPVFATSAKGDARKLFVSGESVLSGILFVLQTGISWEDLPNPWLRQLHNVLAAAAGA